MASTRTYDNSGFINCPFDPKYGPLFEALTFSVIECGFVPRSAREADDGTEVRITKINNIIRGCRLAIHDLSRTESDGDPPLPRFNMPLELGVFVSAKGFGNKDQKRKAALILDTEKFRYRRFLSDIAGQDISAHEGDPAKAVGHVRNFLANHVGGILPGTRVVADRYEAFRRALPDACRAVSLDPNDLSFPDLVQLINGYNNA